MFASARSLPRRFISRAISSQKHVQNLLVCTRTEQAMMECPATPPLKQPQSETCCAALAIPIKRGEIKSIFSSKTIAMSPSFN
jgi:hypothetical protein